MNCITQDRKGFIWIGTDDGLNRLDGYRIKTFFHHPSDSCSLVNNTINQVMPDEKNNLWIATLEGISYYDPAAAAFANFFHKKGGSERQRLGWATSIYLEPENRQANISIDSSIYRFSANMDYKEYPVDNNSLPDSLRRLPFHYYRLYEDKDGQIWACWYNWIFRIDRCTKGITASFPAGHSHIRSLFQDSDNNYWAGTFGEGLLLLDPVHRSFKKMALDGNSLFINAITEWKDKNDRRWLVIASEKGLTLMDRVSGRSRCFGPNVMEEDAISPGDVYAVFVDKQNILWVGSESGISYVEPSKQLIETWSMGAGREKKQYARPGFAYCFFEDDSCILADNWPGPGLYTYDWHGQLKGVIPDLYPSNPDLLKGSTSKPYCILKQPDGTYWFSTDIGLVNYDPHNLERELYRPSATDRNTGFRKIAKYNDTTWWIRTRNNGPNGVFVFNPVKRKFTEHYYYMPGCADCLPPYLMDMIVTRNMDIYVSPKDNYLYRFDKKANRFSPLFTSKQEMEAAPSRTFDCMTEDTEGNLWIGSDNGLFEYDPVNRKIIKDYSKSSKLGGVAISQLCFDDDDNLWMTSERGLYCLEHTTAEIFNFNTGDGLPSNSFPGFLARGKNGYMYGGAVGDIVRFRPRDLLHHTISGQVHFSDITVRNEPYRVQSNDNSEKVIHLEPGQTIFSIDFSVTNYDGAANNRYYYRLNNIMKEWKENENGHLAFYNLSPDVYTLYVAGSDKYGRRLAKGDSIVIDVKPYWWQTRWFYISLLVIVASAIYFFERKRVINIRNQVSLKAKVTEMEMMALRAQMNPHFIFNCLSIIDGFIMGNRKPEAQDFLQKFSKLIRLVLESSQYQEVPLQHDLEALKIYTELEAIRSNHHFTFRFDVDECLIEENYKIPPLLLQPYVENAIIHGLRNLENIDGELLVCIKKTNDGVLALIVDNGIGRQRSTQLNVENKKPNQPMGMNITGKRMELWNQVNPGKIEVYIEDIKTMGKTGTRVRILLPYDLKFE